MLQIKISWLYYVLDRRAASFKIAQRPQPLCLIMHSGRYFETWCTRAQTHKRYDTIMWWRLDVCQHMMCCSLWSLLWRICNKDKSSHGGLSPHKLGQRHPVQLEILFFLIVYLLKSSGNILSYILWVHYRWRNSRQGTLLISYIVICDLGSVNGF